MMFSGTMTLIVVLVLIACVVIGIGIVVYALGRRSSTTDREACPSCSSMNPGHAEFCGQCGRRLGESQQADR